MKQFYCQPHTIVSMAFCASLYESLRRKCVEITLRGIDGKVKKHADVAFIRTGWPQKTFPSFWYSRAMPDIICRAEISLLPAEALYSAQY